MTTPPIVYFLNGPNTRLYGLDRNELALTAVARLSAEQAPR